MGQTTFYQKNYVGWPPIPIHEFCNENSSYWKERAAEAACRLVEMIGQEAYEKLIDDQPVMSWKEYHEFFTARLSSLNSPGGSLPSPAARGEPGG